MWTKKKVYQVINGNIYIIKVTPLLKLIYELQEILVRSPKMFSLEIGLKWSTILLKENIQKYNIGLEMCK